MLARLRSHEQCIVSLNPIPTPKHIPDIKILGHSAVSFSFLMNICVLMNLAKITKLDKLRSLKKVPISPITLAQTNDNKEIIIIVIT